MRVYCHIKRDPCEDGNYNVVSGIFVIAIYIKRFISVMTNITCVIENVYGQVTPRPLALANKIARYR